MLAVAPASAKDGVGGQKEKFRCKAKGADVEMQARFESRDAVGPSARRKFRVELEGGPQLGLVEGDLVFILVDGVNVGTLPLEAFQDGDVAGEVRFESRVKADRNTFPATFPATVGAGTEVNLARGETTVLGCTLD